MNMITKIDDSYFAKFGHVDLFPPTPYISLTLMSIGQLVFDVGDISTSGTMNGVRYYEMYYVPCMNRNNNSSITTKTKRNPGSKISSEEQSSNSAHFVSSSTRQSKS